ncbi:MAG: transposase [Deltaproteobacteria bacterium]|nr:transposase [Deltaproteobacteria bacterium]
MSCVPQEVLVVLCAFAPLFSKPVWNHARILAIGAILSTGKRTVTSSLRVMGLREEERFTNFHRVLNRAKWNSLQGAKILLGLLISLVPAGSSLIIGIDETIERRKGKKIKSKGCYRDAVRSTGKNVVKCFGLKWISMMLIVPLPWSKRPWALPFLTVLASAKRYNEANGKRHKTTVDWAIQMIKQVRRWLPGKDIVLVGDGAYAAVALALCCAGLPVQVTLVSRLRLDAALYDSPPPDQPGKRGPKPKKGKKQRSLQKCVANPKTIWTPIEILWYDGIKRSLEIFSGISLWYTPGKAPVPIKWIVVRDPEGKLRTEAFFCTNLEAGELQILRWFILRWNIEVTFEDLRAHLGIETQRQWSDKAIARSTPALFGLFSIVVLVAIKMLKDKTMPILKCAWYRKPEATFSDGIAFVRRHIWSARYFENSPETADLTNFEHNLLAGLLDQVCYAA